MEYAHILNGHIGYDLAKGGLGFMTEDRLSSDDEAEEKHNFLLEQTLEYDADSTAAFDLINLIIHYGRNYKFIPDKFLSIAKKTKVALSFVAFASNAIFEIFGDGRFASRILFERKHPSFNMRRKVLTNTEVNLIGIKMVLGRFDQRAAEEFKNGILIGLQELSEAFSVIGLENDAVLSREMDEKNVQHVRLLFKNWTKLRPALQQYAFIKLNP
jgi:hypothetical protein